MLKPEDIKFLDSLANRLSQAIYHSKVGAIGTGGSVSTGLTHDDYDKLREITKAAKLEDWDLQHPSKNDEDWDPRKTSI